MTTEEPQQPRETRYTSRVYIMMSVADNVTIAVHVPQHDVPLSNTALRSAVCSFANAMDAELTTPLVALHWVTKPADQIPPQPVARMFTKRLELTLADTGTEQDMLALRRHADQGVRFFASLVSQLAAERLDPTGELRCAVVDIRYDSEDELINGNETVIWDAERVRPIDDDMKEFIGLCDAQV
jgi:hypothetical protein